MKDVVKRLACLALLATPLAQADSLLRVTCIDEESDAVVSVDNTTVGTCPVITAMPPGTYQVRVVKAVGADKEQVFEKQVILVEGRPQSIDAELSAPRLTAQAVKAAADAAVAKTVAQAENGDIDAMNAAARLYETGEGVEKSPERADYWRSRAVQAKAKAAQDEFYTNLQQANNGGVAAMYLVAAAYDNGTGVGQDRNQAAQWRQRAKNTAMEEQLKYAGFFSEVKSYNFNDPGLFTSSTTFVPTSIFKGVLESPSVTSQQMRIRSQAAMRPASFANPDSMIARALKRQDAVVAGQ